MKFVNFFVPENHYFCVAVDTSQSSCVFAHVNMPLDTGAESWQFNIGTHIGKYGAHYQGRGYRYGSNINMALHHLNIERTKEYTSLAQHFADMYL